MSALEAAEPPEHPVCVLSTGRAGTSLATRVLGLLGVELGAEADMMPASDLNERGFWEHLGIYEINQELLARHGGEFYETTRLPEGWENAGGLADLEERARRLVEGSFTGAGRWAFKDPRTIVTLPFWRRVVGTMDYILCVRDPGEVAESIARSGLRGAEPRRSAQFWLDINASALAQTTAERRLIVFYDDWYADARGTAARIAAFLGRQLDDDAWAAIAGFFAPELRHADVGGRSLASPPEAAGLYAHLRAIQAREDVSHAASPARATDVGIAQAFAESHRLRLEMHAQLVDAAQDARAAEGGLERQRAWREAMERSVSWRITAPLRYAKAPVRAWRTAADDARQT